VSACEEAPAGIWQSTRRPACRRPTSKSCGRPFRRGRGASAGRSCPERVWRARAE